MVRSLTKGHRVRGAELRRRRNQIQSWYPYEAKELPAEVEPGRFFITDVKTKELVEGRLIPEMPAALFFSGTYRAAPRGRDGLERALSDFKGRLNDIGYEGRYFAVAHHSEPNPWEDRESRVHVHAIIDHGPTLGELGDRWGDAHGVWKAGLADPGAYYYVARHGLDGRSLVLDRVTSEKAA